jgi:hypothetical protein
MYGFISADILAVSNINNTRDAKQTIKLKRNAALRYPSSSFQTAGLDFIQVNLVDRKLRSIAFAVPINPRKIADTLIADVSIPSNFASDGSTL